MVRLKFPMHMNIRQKIVSGLVMAVLVTGSIGTLSYRYLLEIERKQSFVEAADDVSNIILEIRRYEKNYLLYGNEEDMAENQHYIQKCMGLLGGISPEIKDFKGAPILDKIQIEMDAYGKLIQQLIVEGRGGRPTKDVQTEEQLRERGKNLVGLSQELVSFERQQILSIIKSLKTQLLGTLCLLLALGALLILFIVRNVIRPLRVIEKTTIRIADGDFSPLAVAQTRDETQRVIEAFNRMVRELENRQEQLLQAKKLSSLGTLTSGIAHQLNNPLNNISTSCQIAMEELTTADEGFLRRMLSNIGQEVNRARDIVKGLLEFSRVKEFCLVPTPLHQVVEMSVRLISSQIPSGVEVIQEVPRDLVLALDAQRMQQVFLNLIENAVHAISALPGSIRIAATADMEKNEAIITVEDSGTGIPEKSIDRIFDPFFTTKEVGKGTGLGLSIIYGMIQQHNGTITAENRETNGMRFVIRLPLNGVSQKGDLECQTL